MAVDASIIGGLRQPEQINPLATIGGLMQIREGQARQALQAQQIRESQQRVEGEVEQARQRRRANEGQQKMTELLADPSIHDAIRRGDFTQIYKAGVSPDVAAPVIENVQKMHETTAKLHDADVTRHAAGRALAVQAFRNVDPKNPAAAEQLNSFKQSIAADYPDLAKQMPEFRPGPGLEAQIDDFKRGNGIAAAVLDSDLAQRKVVADIGKVNAEAGKANADADQTAKLTPSKVEASVTGAAQAAKVLAGTSATGITATDQAREAETAKHNRNTEATTRAEVALKQKTFDATLGSGLDANGQPLSPEAMKTAALQDPTAQAIANYQISPPAATLRGGAANPIMRKVLAINPAFRGDQFESAKRIQESFTSGKNADSINAINTAAGHLSILADAADALGNSDVPALNRLANFVGVQTGRDAATTYNTIVHRVGPELTRSYVGAAGGEGDRRLNESDFDASRGAQQIKSSLGVTAKLLGGKIDALKDQYEKGIPGRKFEMITPAAQATFQKLGGHGGSSGAHVIELNGKHYSYKGSGATDDINSYAEVK